MGKTYRQGRMVTCLWVSLVFAAVGVFLPGCPDCGCPTKLDCAQIQADMEGLSTFLDSDAYGKSVSWEEHIVLTYKLAQGREPSLFEFKNAALLEMKPSVLLSAVLCGDDADAAWEKCAEFLGRVDATDFVTDEAVSATVKALQAATPDELAKAVQEALPKAAEVEAAPTKTTVPNVAYNTYFGYMHSHSELSDGTGTALQAYTYARDVGDLDFFALTDHGEQLPFWPWQKKYDKLKAAAEATNAPGTYATLYGFEWGSPLLGHITVINSTDYTGCVSTPGLGDIYNWIGDRPASFARFNHPGEYDDTGTEFEHLVIDVPAIPQMVGIECFNGGDDFDNYYYAGSWSNSYAFIDVGNLNGWYLGALGGQDNHGADWGTKNDFRTAVQAEQLTRDAVADAYRARRFYVTEDKNLVLDFRCSGYPMGSQLTGVSRQFQVTVSDGNGDQFQQIRLYCNGVQVQTATVSGNPATATFTEPTQAGTDYYYIIVRQTDDGNADGRNDEAISSPIWITD